MGRGQVRDADTGRGLLQASLLSASMVEGYPSRCLVAVCITSSFVGEVALSEVGD